MAATSTNRARPAARRPSKATTKKPTGATKKTRRATTKKTTRVAKKATGATKKAVRKTTSASGSNGSRSSDVIALIKADHAAVNQLFRRYAALGQGALKSRRQVAERVIKELSVHAVVEEEILYPKVRTLVPNGERLVKEALDEHQSVKEALAELDKSRPESEEFDEVMVRVRDEVRHHVKEEETSDGILGRLRKHASPSELREMATLMRAAKKVAPTRPHPKAPSTPPGNIFIGAAAAIVDKARDTLTGHR
jgi:hemerythrin superfamily protein